MKPSPVPPQVHPPSASTAALEQYRRRACVYDLEMAPWEPIRLEAIELLALQPGNTVLDVGCGTGLSLAPLRQGVGPGGQVVGIEQSADMLAIARQRQECEGWGNVTLTLAPVAEAPIDVMADAALFHFTHDILQQAEAVAKVMSHLKPGARVVACGLKWAGPFFWPTNFMVLPAALHSVSSLAGMEQPWRLLARHVPGLRVESRLGDGAYLASAIVG
ncbi:class I SAM-dependent methyltransferase [Variovorax sp. HJSM1_2]|uniref:class I SAM-dependent methyltransferase n=1 Tax=Variovorax sp. HJSM1_2 TaxID=3366263 RepID=UPI003BC93EFD